MRSTAISGAVVTLVLVMVAVGLAASSPMAAQARAADPVLELAERLLSTPFGPFSAQAPTVQLLPGQLPNALPLALLQPAGTRVVGSMVRSVGGKPQTQEVVLDVPGDAASVSTAYEKDFTAKGWKPPRSGLSQQHGFVSSPPASNQVFCQGPTGP